MKFPLKITLQFQPQNRHTIGINNSDIPVLLDAAKAALLQDIDRIFDESKELSIKHAKEADTFSVLIPVQVEFSPPDDAQS